MHKLIIKLITQSKKATPEQLAQLIAQASLAPFASDLLEVDEPLWGSFWQGDVIAPGYRLPAVELALLRATRLDQTWPEGTAVAAFLADLHAAISDPQAGVWTLMAAGEPCAVFASVRGQGSGGGGQTASITGRRSSVADQPSAISHQPSAISHQPSATVVWYCATTEQLHAGYRTAIDSLNFSGAVVQRPSVILSEVKNPRSISSKRLFAGAQSDKSETFLQRNLAARLDTEILRLRAQASAD